MVSQHYTLTLRTSPSSATAFCIEAPGDDDAISLAWRVVNKLADLYSAPRFQVTRRDGTLVFDAGGRTPSRWPGETSARRPGDASRSRGAGRPTNDSEAA